MRWAAAIIFAAAIPAFASTDQWTRITTPDFELYTTAGEKSGRETVRHFEQVREFFLKASPVRGPADFPVRIVEFQTEQQYQPFKPNNFTAAYFVSRSARDYIVMGDQAAKNNSIAIHEYMHLIIRHSGLKIPLWLNEGWADVYSTMRPMGKETAVGDLLPDRMQLLQREKWLDFNELTSTDANSPNYHEASRAGIFYAESWALTHMLYLSPEYKDNFGKFVMALHHGKSAGEACMEAFNRTPEAVFQDLRAYLDRKRIYGRVYATGLENVDAGMTSATLPAFDSRLMLADLLVATGKLADAKQEYARLETEQPGNAGLARAIGNEALVAKDVETARRYFEKAFQEGDGDAQMCLQLALMEGAAKQPLDKIIPILERAVKSKPDYTEAKIQLGFALAEARDFPRSILALTAISNVSPERAPAVFCGLSYAYIETGDVAAARQNAESCRKWAKTEADTRRADELLKLVNGRSQPAAAVHPGEKLQQMAGMARSIECSSEGNRLQIAAGDKVVTFDLPSPEAVEITHKPAGYAISCGALQPAPVGVEYAPPRSAMQTSVGIVRRLVF
jgi:tetratricopeptide (TPR) repeat protein